MEAGPSRSPQAGSPADGVAEKQLLHRARFVMNELGGESGALEHARAAVELRSGRTLTDREWARARARLIEFVTILSRWEQNAGAKDSVPGEPRAA